MPPEPAPSRVLRWADLLQLREGWSREEKTVVWMNGCFDVLHVGHLQSLEEAKRLGDVLVVGVNGDAAVRQLKGPDRPVFGLEDRMRLLAALRMTDHVVEFQGLTPVAALSELQPDVVVKGDDYAPPLGKPMPEREIIGSYGGRIVFIPLVRGVSTTSLIRRVRSEGQAGDRSE